MDGDEQTEHFEMTLKLSGGREGEELKAIFADLRVNGEEADHGEPYAPHGHLADVLQVENTKDEDKLEEYEIPKLIFDVLLFILLRDYFKISRDKNFFLK